MTAGVRYPTKPVEAYYLRRYSSCPLALRAYKRVGLSPTKSGLKGTRSQAVDQILLALGSDEQNFGAAFEALAGWCKSIPNYRGWLTPTRERRQSPEIQVALELERYIMPLISAYEDPRRFFSVVVLLYYRRSFELPPDDRDAAVITGALIKQWGPAVLLNPVLRHVFVTASSANQHRLIDLAERRSRKRGRPKAVSDAAFARLRKRFGGNFEAIAVELDTTVLAVEKRLQRWKRRVGSKAAGDEESSQARVGADLDDGRLTTVDQFLWMIRRSSVPGATF